MPAFLTTSGLQKFAVATPEQPVTVKWMAIGTGTGAVTENMQSLFSEVYRMEIPNPLRDEDNPRNLEFSGFIPTSVGGFTITELGLYDDQGSLIAYHLLDESIVKSSPDSTLKTDMYPTFVLALSNASDVELFVSTSREFSHKALTDRNHADAHNIASITGLQGVINDFTQKDLQNVKITGNQNVSGVKTFNSGIAADSIKSATGASNVSILTNNIKLTSSTDSIGRVASIEIVGGALPAINFTGKMNGDASGLSEPTTAKKGAIRVATDAEVTAGADVIAAVTPRQVNLSGFGSSTQQWADVTSQRALKITYTNTTGRGIFVAASLGVNTFDFYIDGKRMPNVGLGNSIGFVIPNGSTYSVGYADSVSNISILSWWELR